VAPPRRWLEELLASSRFSVLVAVIGSGLAGVAILFIATIDVLALLRDAVHYADFTLSVEARVVEHDLIIAHVVEVVDGYLLGAVLLIFSLGLYELFLGNIQKLRSTASRILIIESFDDLKDRLAKVIILILIVNLFRDAISIKLVHPIDLIAQGGAVALVAIAVYLSARSGTHQTSQSSSE
jgi:uncharacterized membrane protein YqhA